jgi:hypothetical protein
MICLGGYEGKRAEVRISISDAANFGLQRPNQERAFQVCEAPGQHLSRQGHEALTRFNFTLVSWATVCHDS